MPLMTPVRTIALSNAAVVSRVTMTLMPRSSTLWVRRSYAMERCYARNADRKISRRILGIPRREKRALRDGSSALIREIEEELLCEIEVADEVCTSEYAYDFGTVRLITFICHLINGMPRLTEHTDIRWLDPSAMPQLNWAPVDRTAVGIIAGMRFLTQTTSGTSEEPSRP